MRKKEQTVTKADLAKRLSELGLSRRYCRRIVDYFFSEISDALRKGEIIHLVGFGSFRYKVRKPRRGRNPKTGAAVEVPQKRVIQFRPGSWLKKKIRK
ncbi:HU family DNA-binding protein [candidate division FCPU426 bacterium]|nr:HU family DNA-binding protein [candidate division FCPU426 bacterium]